MLGLFAEKQRIRIRKQKNPMITMNRAGFSPDLGRHYARGVKQRHEKPDFRLAAGPA